MNIKAIQAKFMAVVEKHNTNICKKKSLIKIKVGY